MADERTITTVFTADISQFTASTQGLNRYISQVNSEFKNATASMGRWNDNAEGLRAKLTQLNGVLDAETRKLGTMEQSYADLVAQGKQNTKEAQQLATQINNQSAKVKEAQKNINFYTASLKELDDAGVNTKNELEQLKQVQADQAKQAEEAAKEAAKQAEEIAKANEPLNVYARNIDRINSEFKLATSTMSDFSSNTDGIKAKITQLNGTLDEEKNKLSYLEQQYADLVTQGKENTVEAQNLQTAIISQNAVVSKTEITIKAYSDSLKELEDAGVNTKEELKNVNKALAEQARVAEQEAAEAAKAAAKAQEELNKKLEDQKQAAKEAGDALLKGAAVGIAGIATACVGAIAGLAKLVDETKELRTQLGMLETSFTENDLSAEAATKTYDELYSILGDSGKATEAALQLGNVAKSEEELSQMTGYLTGVYAKFGDSLPLEGLSEAISHTISLGGSVQGSLADALEWAGVSTDDFNKKLETLNTEEERAQLINSTLSEIYGKTGETYKEVNKDVIAANDAQNKYNQAMADIGEKAQPIVTQFKTAMVGVLQTILEKFNEVDISGLIEKISGAITNIVNIALPPLMSAITWTLDNLNWLVPLLGSVVGLIGGITAAIKIYNGVMKIARTVQLAWNLALSMNPIGLIVIAITGLVAAFVILWNKCEGFRNFWKNMWEGIKTAAKAAGEFISGIFSGIMNTVKGVINTITGGINGAIKAINKISVKIPDWVPEFGGKKFGFNIPTIPKLANGGIIDRPTLAMVGEAGKEAVMPLENNTQWIDKLADKLNQKQAATNNYTITNKFEKMETSRIALHKSNLELKKIIKGG